MPAAASPLSAAYARLTETGAGPAVTVLGPADPLPRGAGWLTTAGLAGGGCDLDAFLARDEAQVLRDHGRAARPDVVASFALHRYAWPASLLITVPWFLYRRVPRLPVTHVSYDRVTGRMAVRPASFACLPGDPAAALPGAVVVAGEEELRAAVRAAVAEHLEPVLAAFGPRTRRRGRARAFRVLTGPAGEPLPTRDRASCCMFHTVRPEGTRATRATRPRTCDSDRVVKSSARATA
ncbi:iron-sulfur protein [Streptomyces collinus]|uniref:iron-sulfur protein n=1 Tax=Streptomyces collinus TaxID=42684 RepID=UPI0029424FD7|nr:iron-sulfur protein [Streptomyces collinus]